MGDRLFFPLIILLAGGLVLLALSPQFGALPSGPVSVGDMNYDRVSVEGMELNRMEAGGDAEVKLVEVADGAAAIEIVTMAGALSENPQFGPHFVLAADLEVQFSGFEVEILVTARPGDTRGATQMQVNYSTGRDGESGWQVFDLKRDWDTFSFTYKVPVKSGENALDYLAIRPVTPDKTRSIMIRQVEFRRGARWATPSG